MQKVCIIGAEGLLGSEIFFRLQKIITFELCPIQSSNINQYDKFECDLLINANGSSRKGWCNENPKESMHINCISTYEYIKKFKPKRYILISSIEVYSNLEKLSTTREIDANTNHSLISNYGLHKLVTENIIRKYYSDYLIIRLPALLSKKLKKNVVFDIVNNRNLFISPESYLNFISTQAVAEFIIKFLFKSSFNIINFAATSSIQVKEVISLAKKQKYYQKKSFYDLPVEKYQISTELLKKIFHTKNSKYYVEEFFSQIF